MTCSVCGHGIPCDFFEFTWHTCINLHVFHSIVCSGGVDDVGQLRARLQSSHRLDPAAGEAGEHRCREQVTISSIVLYQFYLQ